MNEKVTGLVYRDSLADFERWLVDRNVGSFDELTVSAAVLGKRRGAMADAALLQTLITCLRTQGVESLNVVTEKSRGIIDELDDAVSYGPGIAALAIAGRVRLMGVPVRKAVALHAAKSRVESAYVGDFGMLTKGRVVDLLCVSGADRQYLKPLFESSSPVRVKDKYDLRATVRGLAVAVNPVANKIIEDGIVNSLALLMHELFENTQDHAISDIHGRMYERHVEGVFAGWMVLDPASSELLGASQKLFGYGEAVLGSLTRNLRRPPSFHGFCFSFFDSGPGMAARYLSKSYHEMSLKEERNALYACLQSRKTSKMAHGTGEGFHEVLIELARVKGMIRIRSGRLAVFKCFDGSSTGDVWGGFGDWFGDSTDLPEVAGTLITVFVPSVGGSDEA